MDGVVIKITFSLLLAVAFSGCGWLGSSDDQAFDEELPSLDAAVTTASISTTETLETADLAKLPASTDLSTATPFAMHRQIQQEISQGKVVSSTNLELDYSISITEIVTDGGQRFGVHYDRVRYSGRFANEEFEYDSNSSGEAPPQALAYKGLVDKKFFFRIDRAGQLKLVGFNRFLQRCVSDLPNSHQETVLAHLSAISDADGVSRFVDETVGLLGNGSSTNSAALKPGLRWEQQRVLNGGISTQVRSIYEIESLDLNEAKIKISGFVSSPVDQPIVTVANRDLPSITVTGGTTSGSCTIDRRTGLPTTSRIEQIVEMTVQLPDGTSFDQRKSTISTTESKGTQPQ